MAGTAGPHKLMSNIPLKTGVQVLRIFFDHGEFNLGKLTFTYDAPLNYSQPVADAGADQLVVLPQSTAVLDGSGSTDPGGASLNHQWTGLGHLSFNWLHQDLPKRRSQA